MIVADPVTEKNYTSVLESLARLIKENGEPPEEHPIRFYGKLWRDHKLIMTVLKNRDTDEILGYFVCIPLKESFLKKMRLLKKARISIKSTLKPSDVLTQKEAERQISTGGNVLFISLN